MKDLQHLPLYPSTSTSSVTGGASAGIIGHTVSSSGDVSIDIAAISTVEVGVCQCISVGFILLALDR